jgi:hypothetical protein
MLFGGLCDGVAVCIFREVLIDCLVIYRGCVGFAVLFTKCMRLSVVAVGGLEVPGMAARIGGFGGWSCPLTGGR